MTPELRKDLALSVRSTRRILYMFKKDENRDGLEVLLDRIDAWADRDDACAGYGQTVMDGLAQLRAAMITAMDGEKVSWSEIDRLKAGILASHTIHGHQIFP